MKFTIRIGTNNFILFIDCSKTLSFNNILKFHYNLQLLVIVYKYTVFLLGILRCYIKFNKQYMKLLFKL